VDTRRRCLTHGRNWETKHDAKKKMKKYGFGKRIPPKKPTLVSEGEEYALKEWEKKNTGAGTEGPMLGKGAKSWTRAKEEQMDDGISGWDRGDSDNRRE